MVFHKTYIGMIPEWHSGGAYSIMVACTDHPTSRFVIPAAAAFAEQLIFLLVALQVACCSNKGTACCALSVYRLSLASICV